MRRRLTLLLVISIFFSSMSYSQKLMDSITSGFLKMKMPVGTTRESSTSTIKSRTALLDSFTILKDYSLNKYTAESFYIPNYDSLKARLNRNNYTITSFGGTNSYAIGGTTYYT